MTITNIKCMNKFIITVLRKVTFATFFNANN